MFRIHITFEHDAVLLDDERVAFADIEDADVEDGVLVLTMATGARRIKLKSSDAMPVLDAVLDGIERAHPRAPYRSPDAADPNAASAPKKPRVRPRAVSTGGPDLMIGRTFTAG